MWQSEDCGLVRRSRLTRKGGAVDLAEWGRSTYFRCKPNFMDDQQTTNQQESKEKPLLKKGNDVLLESLVIGANRGSIQIPITLTVHGFLVSGILVSGKEFFTHVGEILAPENTEDSAEEAEKSRVTREHFTQMGIEAYRNSENSDTPPSLIHLKWTKFFHNSGKPIPDNQAVWWRGRLSEVAGWNFGTLNLE